MELEWVLLVVLYIHTYIRCNTYHTIYTIYAIRCFDLDLMAEIGKRSKQGLLWGGGGDKVDHRKSSHLDLNECTCVCVWRLLLRFDVRKVAKY